jgi:LmbE family N-acetylglucosaminyl deacetylase
MNEILGSHILVIGAHPDDEVLGCGGLLAANNAAGGKSDTLIISEGTSAQYGDGMTPRQQRHDQLEEASKLLGVDNLWHWDYPDMRLNEVSHIELNLKIQSLISEVDYSYVFTHHPYDVNQDHRVVFRSTMVATRPTPSSSVRGVFTYHVNSSTEWGMGSNTERFVPNAFLDITKWIDIKQQALGFYLDEIREYPHPRSLEAVKNRALVFGSEVGVEAAEAFNLIYWR